LAPRWCHGAQATRKVYAIYRDITERKKAEEARIRPRKRPDGPKIQINLLPKRDRYPGYDIAAETYPVEVAVTISIHPGLTNTAWRFYLLVSGRERKGLAASLVMANLQANDP